MVDLEAGTIDLIWNGMTITDELKESILISDPYMTNQQVLVGYRAKTSPNTTASKAWQTSAPSLTKWAPRRRRW